MNELNQNNSSFDHQKQVKNDFVLTKVEHFAIGIVLIAIIGIIALVNNSDAPLSIKLASSCFAIVNVGVLFDWNKL